MQGGRAQIDEVTQLHNRKGFWNEFRREHHRLRALNLLDETRSGLHPDVAAAFQPDPAELRRLAEAIVNDA